MNNPSTNPRDQLFTLAKGVNDATFDLMVSQHKLYATLESTVDLDPLIADVLRTCGALQHSVNVLTGFLATLSREVPAHD